MGWGYENEEYSYVIKKRNYKNHNIVNPNDHAWFLMEPETFLYTLLRPSNETMILGICTVKTIHWAVLPG